MAISHVGFTQASLGTTTTPDPTTVTPGLPAGTVAGDRVYAVQYGNNVSDTTPAGWTVLGTKDTVIGSSLGAAAAAAGQRYVTVNYRDYDGVWTMPAWSLVSAAQNTNLVQAITLRKTSGATWNTPTISGIGEDLVSHTAFSASTPSFTTHTNGFLMVAQIVNAARSSTVETISQSGATLSATTERPDGNSSTGNDVGGVVSTCTVTAGAGAAIAYTSTLAGVAQGGIVAVEQTETLSTSTGAFFATF